MDNKDTYKERGFIIVDAPFYTNEAKIISAIEKIYSKKASVNNSILNTEFKFLDSSHLIKPIEAIFLNRAERRKARKK